MGLNTNRILRLIQWMDFEVGKSLCMLGLQTIHIEWNDFVKKAKCFGLPLHNDTLHEIKGEYPVDAYRFFKMLGFSDVHAIDVSEYEGADIIINLNQECPEEYYRQFDVIIDGGTLEHVFNLPVAMKNICRMLKPGGMVIHGSPLAGYIDHGFYSFSPTFFLDFYEQNNYRVLSQEIEFVMDKGEGEHSQWNAVYSQDCRLFRQWNEKGNINEYVSMVTNISNVERRVLWTVAKKPNKEMDIKCPFQRMWTSIEGWNEGRENL